MSKTERREAEKVIPIRGNNARWGGGMSGQERAVTLLLKQMRAPAHPGHRILGSFCHVCVCTGAVSHRVYVLTRGIYLPLQ